MSDKPTPETDAEQFPAEETKGKNFYFVAANFARRIERERHELREKLKALTSPSIDGVLSRMKGNLEVVDRIKKERDELRAEIKHWSDRYSVQCLDLELLAERLTKCERERDELRAEVERLKGRVVELTELLVSSQNREEAQKRQAHSNYADYREALTEVERLKAELEAERLHSRVAYSEIGMRAKERDTAEAEVERLKADKARLLHALGNFTHDNLGGIFCTCGYPDGDECAASVAENAMHSV